jgi:hypothetical protein
MRWRSFLATESVSFGIVLLSIHAALLSSGLGAEALSVHFKSSPPAELLRPFADPIDFSLLITRADGRPVEEGRVAIRVEAPRPGRFFSTDYPLVEGTLLAQMELPIRAGRAQWKQLLPIRGDYRLTARVSGNELQATETFAVHVREHRHKWFAVAGLSVALFALGFVAGRIFTCLPPTVIAISLAAASLPSLPRLADSAMLEIGAASVGWPAEIQWRSGVQNAAAVNLTLRITHLEKSKVVFAVERLSVVNAWSVKFHFPDAGAYQVETLAVTPGTAAVANEQLVEVAGVEPPLSASLPVLCYFIALIAAGIGVGRWSKYTQQSVVGRNRLRP